MKDDCEEEEEPFVSLSITALIGCLVVFVPQSEEREGIRSLCEGGK